MAAEKTNIGNAKMKEAPKSPLSFMLKDKAVKNKHLDDNAVNTRVIEDRAVTPEKLSDGVQASIVLPLTDSLDQKYTNITNELYDMIASLQVGGIALSNQFGDREDIGITQKTLTKMFGAIWDTISQYHQGHNFFDFTLIVDPVYIFNEVIEDPVRVVADCSGAISDFDSVKVYVDDELIPRAESSDVTRFETTVILAKTSTIKVVGTILGREVVKTAQVINEVPFFMGSGNVYTDVMNEECRKELIGTLEGDYDVTIKNTGEYMFIIIPISHKDEFRRADMNGLGLKVEIPMQATITPDYVVYKSLNTYKAGTYNVDIDINS